MLVRIFFRCVLRFTPQPCLSRSGSCNECHFRSCSCTYCAACCCMGQGTRLCLELCYVVSYLPVLQISSGSSHGHSGLVYYYSM
ncbi:hypothetical protein OH76DRAFT_166360 [Lentinus brumalis]|uniref:Uncharacterized protein n=1 Tax=Lentinus brumalis TaxID=2498619 RepID=A0A371DJ29_9APHY|nr:hypothetical protein OH76DRAFT_166360 [Polyporus brumalis]